MFELCTRTYVTGTTVKRASLRGSEEMTTIVEALGGIVTCVEPVGSRITCTPAPTTTDEDWLMLTDSNPAGVLKSLGFVQDRGPGFYTGNDDGQFRSWRRGEMNIITTPDSQFYERFLTATHLATRFNLLDKQDRIALFQAVLYGVDVRNLVQRRAPVEADALLMVA